MKDVEPTEKIKINLTLKESDADLFRKALEIVFPASKNCLLPSDKRRLVTFALWAFLRAAIKDGKEFKPFRWLRGCAARQRKSVTSGAERKSRQLQTGKC
jgi:hypothetical protein